MSKKDTTYRNMVNDRASKQQLISFTDLEPTPVAKEEKPTPKTDEDNDTWRMCFASFGSGSSGNCAYIGSENAGVLIDAGTDHKQLFQNLAHNGIMPQMIKGIILTHDHADHIRNAYKIVREHKHMRVYCTPKLLGCMLRNHNVSNRIKDYHVAIFKEFPFKVAGMRLTPFDVSHDGTDNMGFMIEGGGNKFVIAPDMGTITSRAEFYMKQANYLMIESNYDRHMLDNGHYPEYLKNRVRSIKGHLDNRVTAEFVSENYSEQLKYVFLSHLSNDNNTPALAWETVAEALRSKGLTVGDGSNAVDQRNCDIQLYALPRYDMSTWFVL